MVSETIEKLNKLGPSADRMQHITMAWHNGYNGGNVLSHQYLNHPKKDHCSPGALFNTTTFNIASVKPSVIKQSILSSTELTEPYTASILTFVMCLCYLWATPSPFWTGYGGGATYILSFYATPCI